MKNFFQSDQLIMNELIKLLSPEFCVLNSVF